MCYNLHITKKIHNIIILYTGIECYQGLLIALFTISDNNHNKKLQALIKTALKEGICEEWPLSLQLGHTDFNSKQSVQLLRHWVVSYNKRWFVALCCLNTVHMFVLSLQTFEMIVAFPCQKHILINTRLQREFKHGYLR